jgi:hypothetical protein
VNGIVIHKLFRLFDFYLSQPHHNKMEKFPCIGVLRTENLRPHFLHVIRHHLREDGVNIHMVQELMGQADVGTTEIYTHVMQKDISAIHSPLDRRRRRPRSQGFNASHKPTGRFLQSSVFKWKTTDTRLWSCGGAAGLNASGPEGASTVPRAPRPPRRLNRRYTAALKAPAAAPASQSMGSVLRAATKARRTSSLAL